jgi:hypothetical protein
VSPAQCARRRGAESINKFWTSADAIMCITARFACTVPDSRMPAPRATRFLGVARHRPGKTLSFPN